MQGFGQFARPNSKNFLIVPGGCYQTFISKQTPIGDAKFPLVT